MQPASNLYYGGVGVSPSLHIPPWQYKVIKELKEQMNKSKTPLCFKTVAPPAMAITLGTLQYAQQYNPVPCAQAAFSKKMTEQKEVENTMTNLTVEQEQKKYLNDRARNVYYALEGKLYKQFNLQDDAAPKTKADFIDRITNGKFMIRDTDDGYIAANDWDDDEDNTYYGILEAIRWRDPAKKEDMAGKNAADQELSKKLTEVKDQIMIADAATGLKAVQDFEAWVPSNLPS